MATDRRTFLKSAGVTAALASAVPLGLSGSPVPGPSSAAAAPAPRGAMSSRFVLELEGKTVDVLLSAGGGYPFGRISEYQSGNEALPDKFVSGIGFEDLVIEVGAGFSEDLRTWMRETLEGNGSTRSGRLHVVDFNMNVQNTLEFHDSLLREITFPACDASSKEPASLLLRLAPTRTRYRAGSGKADVPAALKQKQWIAANFRVSIPPLPTSRVSKVEALTVKQKITEVRQGTDRFPTQLIPGRLEYPNLVATFSVLDGAPWFATFEDFAINGNGSELAGTLDYLGPDLSAKLLALDFHNLGIVRCEPQRTDGGPNSTQLLTGEFYVEGISLPAVQ